MPYSKDNPPEAIRGLPAHAQEIWIAAFNNAHKQYEGNEEKAHATAWAAVKQKYTKTGDKWVAKEGAKVVLTLEAHGGVPEWICILPLGERKLNDGRDPFFVTEAAMLRVLTAFEDRGNDLVVDYEHSTMGGGEAPAAGWIKQLEAREDGLWARVEWNEKALGYLNRKEYRYFSPVVQLDADTREVNELLNAALTNFPALAHLTPLMARYGELEVAAMAATDKDKAAQKARSSKYGIGIKEGGNITKPGEYSGVSDELFADPVNYRYPLDDAHIHAAWSYWSKPKNQEQYSPEERGKISARIKRRAKAAGMQISEKSRRELKMLEKIITLLGLPDETDEAEALLKVKEIQAMADRAKELTEALQAKDAEIKEAKDGEKAAALKAQEMELKANKTAVPLTITRCLGMDGTPATDKILNTIEALKVDAEGGRQARQELAELKATHAKEASNHLVEKALNTGRTSEAELEQGDGALRKLALDNPELFKTLVMNRPEYSVVPLNKLNISKKDALPGADDDLSRPAHEVLALKARQLALKEKIGLDEATNRVYAENPDLVARWEAELARQMTR